MSARILVIEDNLTNLDLMTYLLTAFGHVPLPAHDGEEGLYAAAHEHPDLIICDLQLPGMDGYEVARWLKGHPELHAIPLVAVTALAMVGDRDRVLAAGFDGYIAKPITPETFVEQIERFLEHGSGSWSWAYAQSSGPRLRRSGRRRCWSSTTCPCISNLCAAHLNRLGTWSSPYRACSTRLCAPARHRPT
jgi:CheY-like chemotaxis protein